MGNVGCPHKLLDAPEERAIFDDSRPDVQGCDIILTLFRVERFPVSSWRSNRVQELIQVSSNFVCADIRFHP